jgi:hypothetical protein
MDARSQVTEAVKRAISSTELAGKRWHVCVRSPDGEDLISFYLGSFKDIDKLAREIRSLGYELKMLDPTLKQCDFLLEPQGRGEGLA